MELRKYKADLENHLWTVTPAKDNRKIVDVASQRLGPKGVIGATGVRYDVFEQFRDLEGYDVVDNGNHLFVPEKSLYVVRGQEVATTHGDFLAYGHGTDLNTEIKSGRKKAALEDKLQQAAEDGAIVIIPFSQGTCGETIMRDQRLMQYVDAFEVFSGNAWLNTRNTNGIAQEAYADVKDQFDIGAISSTDGHSAQEIGMNWTELKQQDTETDFIDGLRKDIKAHKDFSGDKQANSHWGALDHAAKMVGIIAARKAGIKRW